MNEPSPQSHIIHSKGIFRGLPDIPSHLSGLRAIVVGASGTSGQPMVDVLSSNSERWEKVYALSRRPPKTKKDSNVEHVPMDLLYEPDKIVAILREYRVQADYIFYFGYVQLTAVEENDPMGLGDAEHLAEVNGRLFENLLFALDQASITPKRVILQTGGKNYGVHQGFVNVPLKESDPRVELEPNFYYTQEDILSKYVKGHPKTNYNVVMPQWILSAVAGTDMTIFYPLAVYAAVLRKLNKPLLFPGDLLSWDNPQPISTGILNSSFYEWLVLSPHTAGESFNITNGGEFTWSRFWPILASWYGLEWQPPSESAHYDEIDTGLCPRGYGPTGKLRSSFSIVEWAREPTTQEAWVQLSKEHGLEANPFGDPEKTFNFLQFCFSLTWSWYTSIDKAREYGWYGYCDTVASMRQVFEEFADMKMTPPLPR
ncbi:uncharacterized protein TRUGW13939_11852 [Talaromyces rugulosus]|uniref:PRISE-like Rossmann-fold domain-containing protein n=1 Tax=Talaromyces rugulosus TaxID=121627 RepID=A0A7H8REH2_TALRU|nr:uncharacterized protein TRUGW13939_11852 [Talaromyces rugulosus]QKX64676.1 hypothetical protein TRUGW13939_11852 [Talaromyces rugulosus]